VTGGGGSSDGSDDSGGSDNGGGSSYHEPTKGERSVQFRYMAKPVPPKSMVLGNKANTGYKKTQGTGNLNCLTTGTLTLEQAKRNRETLEGNLRDIIVGDSNSAIDASLMQLEQGSNPYLGAGAMAGIVVKRGGTKLGKLVLKTGYEVLQGLLDVIRGTHKAAVKSEGLVNLASPKRTQHILYGDKTGGGHLWPGNPGKSTFLQSWDADTTMHYVSDIATDPTLKWESDRVVKGIQRYNVIGERQGINVQVVVEPDGEGIITAFPK
ncbi:MAG: hypothetical protein ACYC4E_01815, partial [Carboxydocellales bacterium]